MGRKTFSCLIVMAVFCVPGMILAQDQGAFPDDIALIGELRDEAGFQPIHLQITKTVAGEYLVRLKTDKGQGSRGWSDAPPVEYDVKADLDQRGRISFYTPKRSPVEIWADEDDSSKFKIKITLQDQKGKRYLYGTLVPEK